MRESQLHVGFKSAGMLRTLVLVCFVFREGLLARFVHVLTEQSESFRDVAPGVAMLPVVGCFRDLLARVMGNAMQRVRTFAHSAPSCSFENRRRSLILCNGSSGREGSE
jgi:hypothetical protein